MHVPDQSLVRGLREEIDRAMMDFSLPEACGLRLVGDMACGAGHELSDAEIMVILDDEDGAGGRCEFTHVAERRYEIVVHSTGALDAVAQRLAKGPGYGRFESDLDLAQRLAGGVTIKESPGLRDAVKALDGVDLRRLQSERARMSVLKAYAAVIGLSYLGFREEAYGAACRFLTSCSAYWATANGRICADDRYLRDKLAGIPEGQAIYRRFLGLLEEMSFLDAEEVVDEVSRFAADCGIDVGACRPELKCDGGMRLVFVGDKTFLAHRDRLAFVPAAIVDRVESFIAAGCRLDLRQAVAEDAWIARAFYDLGWVQIADDGLSLRLASTGNRAVPVPLLVTWRGVEVPPAGLDTFFLADLSAEGLSRCGAGIIEDGCFLGNARKEAIGAIRSGRWYEAGCAFKAMALHARRVAMFSCGHVDPDDPVVLHKVRTENVRFGSLLHAVSRVGTAAIFDRATVARYASDVEFIVNNLAMDVLSYEIIAAGDSTIGMAKAVDLALGWSGMDRLRKPQAAGETRSSAGSGPQTVGIGLMANRAAVNAGWRRPTRHISHELASRSGNGHAGRDQVADAQMADAQMAGAQMADAQMADALSDQLCLHALLSAKDAHAAQVAARIGQQGARADTRADWRVRQGDRAGGTERRRAGVFPPA